jgi:hypothetical protein
MIRSLWQIDFTTAAGTTRLLSVGDGIAEEIRPRVAAPATQYAACGADWGGTEADGGALTSMGFTVRRGHESHAALRGWCMRHASLFPGTMTGTLTLTIDGGETWAMDKATLSTTEPAPLVESGGFKTITTYAATGGRLLPVSEIDLYPGIPWEFINQSWEDLTDDWETY